MKRISLCLLAAMLAFTALAGAQTTSAPADLQNPNLSPLPRRSPTSSQSQTGTTAKQSKVPAAFSRLAISGGVGLSGINMQVAVNANRYLNLRGIGNYLDYNLNNQKIDSYTVNGNLHFATGGAVLDYYPFYTHGLRISAGAQFHNENQLSGNVTVAGGTELTLNSVHYYSSSSSPIMGSGSVLLNKQQIEPMVTLGWGNLISRKGGHWSIPVEIGAVMIGEPDVKVALTSGQACDANGANCVDVASNATVQSNLQSQIAKYKSDLNPIQAYPIFSIGIGYNFRIR